MGWLKNLLWSVAEKKRQYEQNYVGTGFQAVQSDNPMYQAYYDANPALYQQYHKTILDDLFSGVFRTGYDKWLDEMRMSYNQYNAGVTDLQQQNEYNSESAQASRMRNAGENPDLLGTEGVSDSAGMTPDVADVAIPDAVDFSQVASFAGMIGKCFTGALGMASAGIDLIGKVSTIDGQQISNANSMQELALQYIRNSIPSQGLENDADYNSWKEKLGVLSQPDVAWDESLARSLGLKKHQRKAFDFSLNNAIGSLPAELERFKLMDEYADKKLSSARKTSSSFYDESFEVMKGLNIIFVSNSDAFERATNALNVAKAQVEGANVANESLEAVITNEYLNYASEHNFGREQAIVEGEGFNITKEQQSIQRKQNRIDSLLKDTRQKILDMLQGMADEGNSFAQYMIYNMMLHEYMNFDFKANLDIGAGIGKHLPSKMQGWIPNLGVGLNGEFSAGF